MKSKLPSKLHIGGRCYDITYLEGDYQNVKIEGNFRPAEGAIGILKNMPPQQQANTLIHETLHAIFYEQAMGESRVGEYEEYIVTCFANGLAAVMKQNPKLMAELQKIIDGK